MVPSYQSGFPFLAADPLTTVRESLVSASALPASAPKTRVKGCRHRPSGRLSRRSRGRSMFTPGSRVCAYKTASGRGEWPNRDPLNTLVDFDARVDFLEDSGLSEDTAVSLADQPQVSTDYIFANNCSISKWDFLGLLLTPNCSTISVTGTYTAVSEWDHKWNKVPGNRLTYTACCPSCGHIGGFSLTSDAPIHTYGNLWNEQFSNWINWAQITPMPPGNCVQVVVAVPYHAWPVSAIQGVKLQYSCCSYQAMPIP